jgi:hypothetical protein
MRDNMPSFKNKKQLRFIITLGVDKFTTVDSADHVIPKGDQIILDGFRASIDIERAGGVQMSFMRARIYGLTASDINSITTVQMQLGVKPANTIEVFAIDGDAESLVFAGNIVRAWGDYQNMPDVFLMVQAQAAYFNQLRAVQPASFKGPIPVAEIMAQLAAKMGYTFENNGVTAILTDPYLSNNAVEQMKEVAAASRTVAIIDDKTLFIFPIGGSRKGLIPLISAETGLIGYPTFDGVMMQCQMIYNPAVVHGCRIKIESDIPQTIGEWIIASVSHRLESERIGGIWASIVKGTRDGLAITSR